MNQDIIAAIDQERTYQDRKWPGRRHTVGEGLMVLRKVLGDAFQAWGVGGSEADEKALHEVRQVTAVGVAIMEHCGVRCREPQDNVNQTDLFDPKSPPDTGVKSEFDIAWPAQKLWLVEPYELSDAVPAPGVIVRPDWRSYRIGPTLFGYLEDGQFTVARVDTVDHTNMGILMTANSKILPYYQKYFPDLTDISSVTMIQFSRMSLGERK